MIDAIDLPSGGRRVIVQADTVADGCPDCGVVSERVHAWSRQRVKDLTWLKIDAGRGGHAVG